MAEHGHSLLINYIKDIIDLNNPEYLAGKTIIEIGSVREDLEGQNSTNQFSMFCNLHNMNLISVDMDEQCSENARQVFKRNNFKQGQVYTAKGEDYLKTLSSFDFIYLDGYDYEHGLHSEERQDRYIENMGKPINDEDCWNGHLFMCEHLNKIATENSIICFDDIITNDTGKGVKAIPFLLDNGWYIIKQQNRSMLLSKKKPALKEIFIVGNGKSLKDFDFNYLKDKEWVGCCLGFRHWEKLGFYPDHYVCVDNQVCKCHLEKIKDMIINNKCKSFLLCGSIIEEWRGITQYKNVHFIQQFKMTPHCPFRNLIDYCSGTSAVCYGYCLNNDIIHLLGMDCQYKEFLPECIKRKDGSLKIIKPIKDNPNYYFNDYQRVGDIYNVPNANKVHKVSWEDLRNLILLYNILTGKDIKLYNYNINEVLDPFFERRPLSDLKIQD